MALRVVAMYRIYWYEGHRLPYGLKSGGEHSPSSILTMAGSQDQQNSNTNWSAHYDDEGSMYYYNSVTEETTWDPPEEGFLPPDEKRYIWSALYDDEGELYYHNTETDETSWDPPAEGFNPPPERETEQAEVADEKTTGTSKDPNNDAEPTEPSGPHEHEEQESKDDTAATSDLDVKSKKESDTVEEEEPAIKTEEEQTHVWSAFYDDSGQIYYYNAETQESAWEAPEEGFNPPPPPETSEWVAYEDDEGREYYYNATTGETQWEKPEGFVPQAATDGEATVEENTVGEHAEPTKENDDPQPEEGASPTPVPEPAKSPSPPPVDPAVARLQAAEEALERPDSVLEPSCISNIGEVAASKNPTVAINALIKSYHGQTAVCGLLAKWTTALQGPQVADRIRETAATVIHKAAKEGFKKDTADAIINLSKSEVVFLQEMMDSSRWRKLLIELTAQHRDSAVLLYCLKAISAKGHHREIAQRMDQSEFFAVFNAMLLSELSVVGCQSVSSGSDISAAVAFPDLVDDLCRSCESTSFTYLYSKMLLQELETMALKEIEDDPEPERFRRAIEKWRAVGQSLEMAMIDPSVAGSSAIIRKRRIETALVFSDLQQKRQKTKQGDDLESTLLVLLQKHAAGIQPMESILDKLLPSGLETSTRGVGELLLQYPIALQALLTPLFKSGRAGNASPSLKNKCARLVALATLAADTTTKEAVEEGEAIDELAFQRMIRQGSQLCEQLETLISFVVDFDDKEPLVSPGQKLYSLALKCPPVGLGAILWAKEFTRGRDYALSASFPTLSPSILSLVRLVAVKYPATRKDALEIALTFLGHSNPDISYQKINAIKECALRLILFLLMKGEVIPVLTSFVKRLRRNSDLDASLIRYFVTGALQIVRPPVSPVFVRLFGQLLEINRVCDALRTSYVKAEQQKQLVDLLNGFASTKLHDGSELPQQDVKMVQSLQEMYRSQT